MSILRFEVGGNKVVDYDATSDFTTDSINFFHSHDWSVDISENGTDGNPTFTIQSSNDNSKWYDYDKNATIVKIEDAFGWHYYEFKYMRIVYVATGVTTGTITINLNLNNDKSNH
jgi:hypothetical protein